MSQRILRVFISASYTELKEEAKAAGDAIIDAGCELVSWETTQGGFANSLELVPNQLKNSDVVVALFGIRTSKFALEELEIARKLGLPLLCYVKDYFPDATAALPEWLTSPGGPTYATFDNTAQLKERLLADIAKLRERQFHEAEVRSTANVSNVDPPGTEAKVEAQLAPHEQGTSASDSPPAAGSESLPGASAQPGVRPASDRLRRIADWAKRRSGALFVLGVMALVSYLWWSKSRIEPPSAETPATSNIDPAEQRIPASFGPVDYRFPFSDPVRELPETSVKLPGPAMLIVRAGTFKVGTDPQQLTALTGLVKFEDDELPAHEVKVARPFAIGMHEITVAQYTLFELLNGRTMVPVSVEVTGENSSANQTSDGVSNDVRDNYPVQNVSWDDAMAYVKWLSSASGARYRLPTEAEWELVARSQALGGPESYWGWTPQNDIRSRCGTININWAESSEFCAGWNGPIPVANEYLGTIANMIGNVAEWTADCYQPSYDGAPTDGSAVSRSNCAERVFRGGWWRSAVQFARPAFRAHAPPDFRDYSIGFRVVRELSDAEIEKLVDGPAQVVTPEPTPPTDDESRYPGVVVPDVMGMDEKAAIELLAQAGLDAQPAYKNVRDESPSPVVVSQSPEAGTRTGSGETVQLILTPPPRANQQTPSPRRPANTPSPRLPRTVPQQQEEQQSKEYEANPPQQQQQQQQLPPTSGNDPDASNIGEPSPK